MISTGDWQQRDSLSVAVFGASVCLLGILAILHVAWLGDEVREVRRVVVMEKCK